MNQKPVLCAGEMLFDFFSQQPGVMMGESTTFEKRPGGSPFNIAVGVRRLGHTTAFLTKIGTDPFGDALYTMLANEGILLDATFRDENGNTTLAFVAVDSSGKPAFRFYRDHAADTRLSLKEIEALDPRDYSLYHFGSISLLWSPSREAYLEMFRRFKQADLPVSFDPNIRPSVIDDKKAYMRLLHEIIPQVDILKLSDDDLREITGYEEIEQGLSALGVSDRTLIFLTLGAKGSMLKAGDSLYQCAAFDVKIRETTGCGDAFMAGVIDRYIRRFYRSLPTPDEAMDALRFSNAAAALVATQTGAANAMPSMIQVEEFIENAAP